MRLYCLICLENMHLVYTDLYVSNYHCRNEHCVLQYSSYGKYDRHTLYTKKIYDKYYGWSFYNYEVDVGVEEVMKWLNHPL